VRDLTLREKDAWGRVRGRSAEGAKEEEEDERAKSLLPPPRPPPGLKLRTVGSACCISLLSATD